MLPTRGVRTEGQKRVLKAQKEFISNTRVCPDVTENRDCRSAAGPRWAGRAWPLSPRQRRKPPRPRLRRKPRSRETWPARRGEAEAFRAVFKPTVAGPRPGHEMAENDKPEAAAAALQRGAEEAAVAGQQPPQQQQPPPQQQPQQQPPQREEAAAATESGGGSANGVKMCVPGRAGGAGCGGPPGPRRRERGRQAPGPLFPATRRAPPRLGPLRGWRAAIRVRRPGPRRSRVSALGAAVRGRRPSGGLGLRGAVMGSGPARCGGSRVQKCAGASMFVFAFPDVLRFVKPLGFSFFVVCLCGSAKKALW